VEHGADVTAGDNGALKWASKEGHLDIVKYLEQVNKENEIASLEV